ncbi:aprataxin [Battus philenor]|uniref:aprataxin n=1 Tax=Battus philenor TaxID=42288 RepID=UPI0035D0AFAB
MSKRLRDVKESIQSVAPKQVKKHWSLGLIESMKDVDLIYKETERIVTIRDKYPKAKVHYLVLPKDNISSIYKLGKEHVSLIKEFGELYKLIQEEHKDYTLNAGFHAMPSMQRLHMHIISIDMVSPCLKNKIHWNSFTTAFFKPYEDVLEELTKYGCIKKITNDEHKKLMTTPLKCNQCAFIPKNIPQLKEHLLSHI